jgi:2-keto-4-pentenoate hydratase
LSTGSIEVLSEKLRRAEADRIPIPPLTDDLPDLSEQTAYQVQLANVARRTAAGGTVRGHKVGLTARAMQEQFGINEPDYGHLFGDMFLNESSDVPIDRFIAPRVEIETAFVMGKRLEGPGVTVADVMRAVEFVVASIEVIDSRVIAWRIKLADTIADNGSSAAIVLAGRPRRLDQLDLANLAAELEIDGTIVEVGNSSDVMGNPLSAAAWLVNALGRQGVAIEEGHVVLPGTCVRSVKVGRGALVTGRFEGLGSVSVKFV